MSTRCQIGIYAEKETKLNQPESILYKHSDGYEKETLPLLEDFYQIFTQDRGFWDSEYFSARLMQYLTNKSDEHLQEFKKRFGMELKGSGMTGYGISNALHWDIEYFYACYPDRIELYDTPLNCNYDNFNLIKKIETIKK